MKDPLIEESRKILEVQKTLLDILEPFNDEQRVRIMRAVAAFYAPVEQRLLNKLVLKRNEMVKIAKEQESDVGHP